MATTKKPTTKSTKAAPKKTTARKTTATKKAPVKSRSTSTKSKAKAVEQQSFRPCPPSEPFFNFRINRQTAYWLVLGCIVILLAAWILKLQSDIEYIYDQIEISNAQSDAAEAEIQIRALEDKN